MVDCKSERVACSDHREVISAAGFPPNQTEVLTSVDNNEDPMEAFRRGELPASQNNYGGQNDTY